MKIAGNIPNIYQGYKTEKTAKSENSKDFGEILKVKEAVLKDKVEISGAAIKMQGTNSIEVEFLKRRFFSIDGSREGKIEKLKDDIKNGKYEVSDEEIVEAILKDSGE